MKWRWPLLVGAGLLLSAQIAPVPPSTPVLIEVPGVSTHLFQNPYYRCVRNFYVATTGSDSNNTTQAQNPGTPWLTIGKYNSAIGTSAGGDCINVAAGTYNVSVIQLTKGGTSSAADGYVVYRSTTLGGAIVKSNHSPGGGGYVFQLGVPNTTAVSYVMIDGFEIDGNSDGAGNCISSEVLNASASNHHIWATNNNIHNCAQSGIQTADGDWYWFLHNNVHNNSSSSGFAGSGISVYQPHAQSVSATAFDNRWSPHHIIVNFNYSHDNQVDAGNPTDGNGLILDDWSNHFGGGANTSVQYTTPGLVYGNLFIHNGSKGLALGYGAVNLTVVANNTAYNNSFSTLNTGQPRGDFNESLSYGGTYSNNIAYSVPVTSAPNTCAFASPPPFNNVPFLVDQIASSPGGTPVGPHLAPTYASNIAFGNGGTNWATTGCMDSGPPAASFSCSTNKCNTDPLFVNAGSNNFALQGGSSAIGYVTTPITLPPAVFRIPDAGACYHALTTCP